MHSCAWFAWKGLSGIRPQLVVIKMTKKRKMPIKDEHVDVDECVGGNLNKYLPIRQTKIPTSQTNINKSQSKIMKICEAQYRSTIRFRVRKQRSRARSVLATPPNAYFVSKKPLICTPSIPTRVPLRFPGRFFHRMLHKKNAFYNYIRPNKIKKCRWGYTNITRMDTLHCLGSFCRQCVICFCFYVSFALSTSPPDHK